MGPISGTRLPEVGRYEFPGQFDDRGHVAEVDLVPAVASGGGARADAGPSWVRITTLSHVAGQPLSRSCHR
jgi:hypothetical protein